MINVTLVTLKRHCLKGGRDTRVHLLELLREKCFELFFRRRESHETRVVQASMDELKASRLVPGYTTCFFVKGLFFFSPPVGDSAIHAAAADSDGLQPVLMPDDRRTRSKTLSCVSRHYSVEILCFTRRTIGGEDRLRALLNERVVKTSSSVNRVT